MKRLTVARQLLVSRNASIRPTILIARRQASSESKDPSGTRYPLFPVADLTASDFAEYDWEVSHRRPSRGNSD